MKKNKITKTENDEVIIKVLLILMSSIFVVIILYLFKKGVITQNYFSDNLKLFLGAAAQFLATLIPLVLVIFQLVSSKAPDCEFIFKDLHPRIIGKYQEVRIIKRLMIYFFVVILIVLFSLMFVFDNVIWLMIVFTINVFFLIYLLIIFQQFLLVFFVKSGKDKFFKNSADLIISDFEHNELIDLTRRINENKSNLGIDQERILRLLNPITLAYGRFLLDRNKMGENSYYDHFRELIEITSKNEWSTKINQAVYLDLKDNFRTHIKMCVESPHFKKYIRTVIDILIKLIDDFDRHSNSWIFTEYLEEFTTIVLYLKANENHKDEFKDRIDVWLSEIARNIARNGLGSYDLLLEIIIKIGSEDKERLKFLEIMRDTYTDNYNQFNFIDRKARRKELGLNFTSNLEDLNSNLKEVTREIERIKE